MKKSLLLLLGMFVMVSHVEANNGINPTERIGLENRYDEAVTFIERGVRFHVYLNGEFDFDRRYVRNRRNGRVRISRDFQGRINRVGNVFIRYNYRGNVRRIGQVNMNYRRGFLTRIGGLSISYNRWGNPRFYGQLRYNDFYYGNYDTGFNVNLNLGLICNYNDPYFYRREFRNNYRLFRQDANFYYYRANNNASVSRNKILKRRKQNARRVTTNRNQNTRTDSNRRRTTDRNRETTNTRRSKNYSNQKKKRVTKKETSKRKKSSENRRRS